MRGRGPTSTHTTSVATRRHDVEARRSSRARPRPGAPAGRAGCCRRARSRRSPAARPAAGPARPLRPARGATGERDRGGQHEQVALDGEVADQPHQPGGRRRTSAALSPVLTSVPPGRISTSWTTSAAPTTSASAPCRQRGSTLRPRSRPAATLSAAPPRRAARASSAAGRTSRARCSPRLSRQQIVQAWSPPVVRVGGDPGLLPEADGLQHVRLEQLPGVPVGGAEQAGVQVDAGQPGDDVVDAVEPHGRAHRRWRRRTRETNVSVATSTASAR